jgi:hypothetical protein
MKSLVVLLAAIASASLLALAQSVGPATAIPTTPAVGPPSPSPSPSPAATGPSASSVPLPGLPTGPTLEKNLPLIPEAAPFGSPGAHGRKSGRSRRGGGSGPNASPGASPHDTFGVERDIRLRIRIREAQTRAANDPSVHADWVAAHNTHSDPQRREALKTYYNHLYDRMIQIDPSIAVLANARRQTDINRMYYVRLGEEAPEENPFATPAPAAEGKNPPLPEEPPIP